MAAPAKDPKIEEVEDDEMPDLEPAQGGDEGVDPCTNAIEGDRCRRSQRTVARSMAAEFLPLPPLIALTLALVPPPSVNIVFMIFFLFILRWVSIVGARIQGVSASGPM